MGFPEQLQVELAPQFKGNCHVHGPPTTSRAPGLGKASEQDSEPSAKDAKPDEADVTLAEFQAENPKPKRKTAAAAEATGNAAYILVPSKGNGKLNPGFRDLL